MHEEEQIPYQESEIKKTINDINKNLNFTTSLSFQFTRLKSKLNTNNMNTSIQNSLEMLENNVIPILFQILTKQFESEIPNENLIIRIGEIILGIITILFNDYQKNYYSLLVDEHKILSLSIEILNKIKLDQVEPFKILLKIYHQFIIFDIQKNNNYTNIGENLNTLLHLVDKSINNEEISYNILSVIKSICETEKFNDILINSNENFSNVQFISGLIKAITNSNSIRTALIGIQILDMIVKQTSVNSIGNSGIEAIKNSIENPISFFLKIIAKFESDSSISLYSCKVLSQLIEKKDIHSLILFLQSKTIEDVENKINSNEGKSSLTVLKDIREIFNQKGNEMNFSSLTKSIARILVLMSKDKKILSMLKDLSLLKSFVYLLKSDITELAKARKKDNEDSANKIELISSSLMELVNLNIILLKNCTFDKNDKENKLIQNFCYSFLKVLEMYPKDTNEVYEILTFFQIKWEENQIDMSYIFSFFEIIEQEEKSLLDGNNNESDISNHLMEKTFVTLIGNYYSQKWIYSFIHRIPLNFAYQTTINSKEEEESIFIKDIKKLQKEMNSIMEIYNDKAANNMFYIINSLSFKLILGNTFEKEDNIGHDNMFPQNSFSLLSQIIESLIDMIINPNPKSAEIYNDTNCCYLMTLVFSSIENINFAEKEIEGKCELVSKLINKLIKTKTFTLGTLSYLSMRLNRLVEYKLDEYIKEIFSQNCLCDFVLNSMDIYQQTKQEEGFIKEILIIFYQVLCQTKDDGQLLKFIQENGMVLLMKIIENNTILNPEIINTLIKNIRVLSNRNFDETILIFQNIQMLKKLCIGIKNIKFSKGINENIYYELFIFVRNIFKSCGFFDIADEIGLPFFFVQEFIDISNFYEDTKRNSLEIIAEIISIMIQGDKLLFAFTKTTLFEQMIVVLGKMNSDNNFNSKVFESFMVITGSFFKNLNEKDSFLKEIYQGKVYRELFKKLTEMIIEYMYTINELYQIFFFIEPFCSYENHLNYPDKRILTVEYFKQFLTKLEEKKDANFSNVTTIKEKIENCIQSIEKPELSIKINVKKNVNEENHRMMKDLLSLTTERKNAVRRKTREGRGDEEDLTMASTRRRTLSIANNPKMKLYYEKIISNFFTLVKDIPTKALARENINEESKALSDNLQLLKFFTKDDENIDKMLENGIIDKLVIIMETETIFSIDCQEQSFALFERITNFENSTSFLLNNAHFLAFLFRELKRIINLLGTENELSRFVKAKIICITKILGQLTNEKDFVMTNIQKLNTNNIYDILYNESIEKEMIVNMLKILKNIIEYTHENKTEEELTSENEELCNLLMKTIWPKYENEISIIKVMISIIDFKYKNQEFIQLLESNQLIEYLCKVFIVGNVDKLHKNSEGFLSVLTLLNKLTQYISIIDILSEIAIFPILTTVKDNMFNTKIVEQSLLLCVACARADDKYINKVCITEMKEFTIQIINKYLNTCHTNIVKLILELIWTFMKEEKNVPFYSDNMDNLLKVFKYHLKDYEITSFVFDIVNKITANDVRAVLERSKRSSSIIGGGIKKGGSFNLLLNTSIKFHSLNSIKSIGERDSISYSIVGIFQIMAELFDQYIGNFTLFKKLYQLLTNIKLITTEKSFHDKIIDLIIENNIRYIDKTEEQTENDIKIVELNCDCFLELIKDEGEEDKTDFSLTIPLLCKIVTKFKLNSKITQKIFGLLLEIGKQNNNGISKFIKEIEEIFTWYRNAPDELISDLTLIYFISILVTLCKTIDNLDSDFIKVNYLFYLNKLKTGENIFERNKLLLPKLSDIAFLYTIPDKETAIETKNTLVFLLEEFKKEKKVYEITLIFIAINAFFTRSQFVKDEFENYKSFIPEMMEYISKENLENSSLDSVINSYELSLKKKIIIPIKQSKEEKQSKINEEIQIARNFVIIERQVHYYIERGDYTKCYFCASKDCNNFYAYEKLKNRDIKKINEINISQIESCQKREFPYKKKWGIFSRKLKGSCCFSIFGKIEKDKINHIINIECQDEDTCIKYVNYISSLIKAYKELHN